MRPVLSGRPLRIVQVTDEPWDSGLTDYALTLSQALRDAGHLVTVAVRPGSLPEERARAKGLPTFPFRSWWALRKLIHRQRPDVLNAHTGRAHSAGWFATRGAAALLIRTRGDSRPLRWTPLRDVLYRATSRVIACSEAIRRDYENSLGIPPEQLVTIPPAVACPARFPPLPSGGLRIGIVARLDPVKGHADFLKAAAALHRSRPEVRFLIAGPEANLTRAQLEREAESLGVREACEFTGRRDDVFSLMRSCHAGVVASTGSEAVSRAALEWMSQGRSLIATAVGCLPELVREGETGFLVPPRNPALMAEAFGRLADTPGLLERQGLRAWERVRAEFTLGRLSERTVALYRAALPTGARE